MKKQRVAGLLEVRQRILSSIDATSNFALSTGEDCGDRAQIGGIARTKEGIGTKERISYTIPPLPVHRNGPRVGY